MNTWKPCRGTDVQSNGLIYTITHVPDLEHVFATLRGSEKSEILRTSEIGPVQDTAMPPQLPLELITDDSWREATRRYEIIKPLIGAENRSEELIQARCQECGVSRSSIYRWIRSFEASGVLSALVPLPNRGGLGRKRIDPVSERIVELVIDDFYLTPQRHSVERTILEVGKRCRNAQVPIPCRNTVRKRIDNIKPAVVLERTGQKKRLADRFTPRPGTFGEATFPLSVVQIDHTPMDVEIVDDVGRRPMGRPWLTLAMDVFSRAILGYYISLDRPGAAAVGLCLARSILPKEAHLEELGVKASWPVCGIPVMIHADNAREFRGHVLRRACQQYNITLTFRPVRRPRYGAHIERLLGTTMNAVHSLPGTTFSNVLQRGEYPSAAKAALTLRELELWLCIWIVSVYHARVHSSLGVTPLRRFEQGVFGESPDHIGTGPPIRVIDDERLRLDFMPYYERAIEPNGVVIDKLHYYADVLRPYVAARSRTGKRSQYLFRRDPNDISVVYFWDPEVQCYHRIPYRDLSRPPMSLWDWRGAARRARESGNGDVDERAIFEAHERQQNIVNDAVSETQKQRRHRLMRSRLRSSSSKRMDTETESFKETSFVPFDELEQ